ncbi:MAG: bifunctional riboflavin kinase/FAD synthetase [Clostridiales bacterium]|nr:bifunctional riboflavin kinase/FAD synthetase [Clostridiales bacterium]
MSVLVLGTFDGVHIAHRQLINEAKKTGKRIIVCTFSKPFANSPVLLSPQEKISLLKQQGVDEVFMQDPESVKNIMPEEYIKSLVEKFKPKYIVTGFNHRFGKNASGTLATLSFLGKKYGFILITVPPVSVEGQLVSSTHIRSLLLNGKIESANLLLDRYYQIQGKVVKGKQIGTEIGFPTANVEISDNKLIPQCAVYATLVKLNNRLYKGMTNIGFNETVSENNSLTVETHILGFDGDVYGKNIEILFLKKVRDDKKFESLEDLKSQLSDDALLINAYIDTIKK